MLTRWYSYDDWNRPFSDVDRTFRAMRRLRSEFDRVFGDFDDARTVDARSYVEDAGSEFVVRAELPGLSADQVDVSVTANTVTLAARREEGVPDGYAVHRRERNSYSYHRSYTLPVKIEPERVSANMKDGVLVLKLPKAAEAQPRQITVQAS